MTSTKNFSLSDVIVGTSMMRGLAGPMGRNVMGTVRRILPGICFEVEIDGGTALLWRAYELLTAEGAASARRGRQHRPDRPDEIAGLLVVVDCDFWTTQGTKPLFLATEYDCYPSALPMSPTVLRQKLADYHKIAVARGPNSITAWMRQMDRLTSLTVSADRSPATPVRATAERVCPDAPLKKRRLTNADLEEEDQEEENEDYEEEEDQEDEDEDEDEDQEDEDEEEDEEDVESDFEDEDQEEEMAEEQEKEQEEEDTYIPHITLFGTPRLTNLFREALESEYTISGKHFLTFIGVLAVALLVAIARTL